MNPIYRKQEKKLEKKILNLHLKFLTVLRHDLRDLDDKKLLTMVDINKYGRFEKLQANAIKELGQVSSLSNKAISTGLQEIYEDKYYRTGYEIEKEVQAKLGYKGLDKQLLRGIVNNPIDPLGWQLRNVENNKLMLRQIISTINKTVAQGMPYRDIANAIKERADIGATKAITIVRTEGGRVYSAASLASMEKAEAAGVIMKKRWVSTLDARTRDTHQNADGQEVETDEPFVVGGTEMMAPRMGYDVAEVINCRCDMIPIVAGYAPEFRRVRGEDVIPYKTYNEWKANRIDIK